MSKMVIGLDIDKALIVGQDIDMKILNKTMIPEIKAYAESHTVKETAELFGYANAFHFSKAFKKIFAISPSRVKYELK